MKNIFKAKAGEKTCNECDNYDNCVRMEQNGGSPHNGARTCKQFYPNGQPFESEISEMSETVEVNTCDIT